MKESPRSPHIASVGADVEDLSAGAQTYEEHGLDEILIGCRNQEPAAWRAFYSEHFDFVYRVARRLGTPKADAEDVTHDVFVVVYRKISSFEGGNLNSWLYRITANIVSEGHRKRRVRQAFQNLKVWFGASPSETPERTAQRSSDARAVEAVLQKMAPKKREVFALFEIEGLSGDEIAERIDCPVNTVWTRLHHARKDFLRYAKRLGYLDKVTKK